MKNFWFVATYRYIGEDGKDYFCRSPRGYEVYSHLPLSDKSLVGLVPCETKRDAVAIANKWNEIYKKQGNIATADRKYRA